MKYLILLITVFVLSAVSAQNVTIPARGRISDQDNGGKVSGVKVTLLHNGSEISSSLTSSNGRYQMQGSGPKSGKYTLVYSKAGYVSKKIEFDFSNVNEEDLPAGNAIPIPELDIDLFAERDNVDFSFLNSEPVASFFWDSNNFVLDFDRAASNKTKKKIDSLLAKAEKEAAENEAKYNDAITAGDMYFAQQKYEKAVEKFEEALQYKPKAEYPIEKLDELDALIQAQKEAELAAEQANAKYNDLIKEADALRDSDKLEDAISKYQEAIVEKDEQYPKDQINNLKAEIEKRKKEAENQAKYDAALKEADKLFGEEKLEQSKVKYEEASKLKSSEQYPKDKIAEIEKLLNDKEAEAEKEAKYTKLLKEADALFANKGYEEAIKKYEAASVVKPDENYPKDQIEICKKNLEDLKNQADLDAKIKEFLDKGNKAMSAKNYEDAITNYEGVLGLDDEHAEAKEKLALAKQKLDEQKGEAEKEAEFDRLVSEGDQAFGAENYQGAIDAYKGALEIKSVATVEAKLKDAQSKLNSLQSEAANKEKYDQLMSEGQAAMDAKKWDLAVSKFNSALGVYPKEQLPKDKLAEIESLRASELADAEKDKRYRELMDKGDSYMSQQKYIEAIQEFNNALAVKPGEKEPVEKAAEAQRLAEEANKDADKSYEKILTTAEEKARAGEFDRARELVQRAKQFRPEDDRPDKILALIDDLVRIKKEYDKLMADGDQLAAAKSYEDAKAKYIKAKDLKPEELLPPQKIEEMDRLISESASQAERDQLYKEYMKDGATQEASEIYQAALSAYKNALQVKPNDRPAQDKVDEIQQILDNLANQAASLEQKEKGYKDAIDKADAFFDQERYLDAKKAYDEALSFKPGDQYATDRMNESIRLEKEKSLLEAEEQYQNILKAGDKSFDEENYDKAKDYYTRALSNRPSDPYPKAKLEEIDNILNPVVQDSEELTDLGIPFTGSILDGEVLLRKAEEQRVRNKSEGVVSTVDGITEGEADLTEKKKVDHQETTNEIYQITEGIIARSADDVERLRENATTVDNSMVALERENQLDEALDYRENVGNQVVLEIIDQDHALEYGEKESVYLDNTDIVDNYNKAQEKALSARLTTEKGSNVNADQELTIVTDKIRSEVIDDYKTREKAARLAEEIEDDANAEFFVAQKKEELNVQEANVTIEKIELNIEEKYVEGHEKALDNTEEIKDIDENLVNKEDYMIDVKEKSLRTKDQEVQSKVEKATKAQEGIANNRIENAQILDENTKVFDEDSRQIYNEETEKYLSNVDQIQKSIDMNSDIDEVAEEAMEGKIEYAERMEEKTTLTSMDFENEDEEGHKDAVKVINNIEVDYGANEESQHDRIKKNAPIAEGIELKMAEENSSKNDDEKDELYNAKKEIDKINDEPKEKTVVVNELGKEYPEGVSQEVFTKQDQNGLMTELITRRIVVVDGHADVYIRTQSIHGITYRKNGQPSLEHVWQSETQNPKLERHF